MVPLKIIANGFFAVIPVTPEGKNRTNYITGLSNPIIQILNQSKTYFVTNFIQS
jgi:hypothetical protein